MGNYFTIDEVNWVVRKLLKIWGVEEERNINVKYYMAMRRFSSTLSMMELLQKVQEVYRDDFFGEDVDVNDVDDSVWAAMGFLFVTMKNVCHFNRFKEALNIELVKQEMNYQGCRSKTEYARLKEYKKFFYGSNE